MDADFRDVFEIRGMARLRRGEVLPPHYAGNSLTLGYRGLDGETRRTAFGFSVPVEIKGQRIRIPFDLAHGETRHVTITVSSTGEPASPDRISFLRALKQSKRTARATVRRSDLSPPLTRPLKRGSIAPPQTCRCSSASSAPGPTPTPEFLGSAHPSAAMQSLRRCRCSGLTLL